MGLMCGLGGSPLWGSFVSAWWEPRAPALGQPVTPLRGSSLYVILLLLIPTPTHSIGEFIPTGARPGGMGDAYTALANGAPGLFWNPAAVVGKDRWSAVAGYDRPFELAELETVSGAAALAIGRAGVGLTYQGGDGVGESSTGGVLGLRVRRAVIGVRLRHIQFATLEQNHRWNVVDLGLRIDSGSGVCVGMVGWNATGHRTSILGHGGAVGVSVTREGMTVVVDVQKEAGAPTGGGVGVELTLRRGAWVRLGVGGHPERMTIGIGVARASMAIDYAAMYHTILGVSQRLSVSVSR